MVTLLSIGAVVYVMVTLIVVGVCRAAHEDDQPVGPGPRIGPLARF
jgi:hypothetical protein